jgi:antitoxin ParD1/3/4
MNVSLTPELDKYVAAKVESGRYGSASEVIREALRLLEERDQARSAQLDAFNRELGARLDSLDRGERVDPKAARRLVLEGRKSGKGLAGE